MPAIIMDGRAVRAILLPELRSHVEEIKLKHGRVPCLAAILVGDDPASRQYVKNKQRTAEELGCESRLIRMPVSEASTASLLKVIEGLNADPSVNAILLQVPVPDSVDQFALFDAIHPDKDLDAVGSSSVGGFYRGRWGHFIPCTPRGVLTLLDYYKVPVEGARAVVIGRSDVAGKPMAVILGGRMRNATVTWCHRKTRDLPAVCREADILIPCVGAEVVGGGPFFITADMVKPGACVIDVGFRRIGPGKFAGDVDFEAVKEVAGWLTLNPGGTGPMTVVALMQNLLDATRYQLGLPRLQYSI
jgi:methylenetetrahydrofolate dehydrogenase (NADP+) / methenyltetrahydrofolate cyclohydrolase